MFRVLLAEVEVISLPLLTLTQAPSRVKSRLLPVLFHTRYAARPTKTVVEQAPVPPPVFTVRPKVVLEERAEVMPEPPVELEKFVRVPLMGEKAPFAGPFVMLQLSVLVCPD